MYEELRNRWLDLGDREFEPTYYELLDICPADATPGSVEKALAERKARIRRSIPGPMFFRIALVIERQLDQAAEVLGDPDRRRAYDVEVAREAEELADTRRAAAARERLAKARKIVAEHVGAGKELAEAKRPALAAALRQLGYSASQVDRVIVRIPSPPPAQEQEAPNVLSFFEDMVTNAVARSALSRTDREQLEQTGCRWGLSLERARNVIDRIAAAAGQSAAPSGSTAGAAPAGHGPGAGSAASRAPALGPPTGRRLYPLLVKLLAPVVAAAALGWFYWQAESKREAEDTAPLPQHAARGTEPVLATTPDPSNEPTSEDGAPGRAPDPVPAPDPRPLAEQLLSCTADGECLRLIGRASDDDLSQALRELAFVVRVRVRRPHPSADRQSRARELLYIAYAAREPAAGAALREAGLRIPTAAEQALLAQAASECMRSSNASPLSPSMRVEAQRLVAVVRNLCDAGATDTTQAFVCLAAAAHAAGELARAEQGLAVSLATTHTGLERADVRRFLVGLVDASAATAHTGRRAGSGSTTPSPPRMPLRAEEIKALARQLTARAERSRRQAVLRLAEDGSTEALRAIEGALASSRLDAQHKVDLIRGLSTCPASAALGIILKQVQSRTAILAHEAFVRLSLMLGTQPSTVVPLRNSSAVRRQAAAMFAELIKQRVRTHWRNPLAGSGQTTFNYMATRVGSRTFVPSFGSRGTILTMPGSPTFGFGSSGSSASAPSGREESEPIPVMPEDLAALAALIVDDLQRLTDAWKSTSDPSAAPPGDAAQQPWAIMAMGGTLRTTTGRTRSRRSGATAGPPPGFSTSPARIWQSPVRAGRALPAPSGLPPVPGTSSVRIQRLPVGQEGRAVVDHLKRAAQAIGEKIRSAPGASASTALSVERILARAEAAEGLFAAPLQSVAVHLTSVGELCMVYAAVRYPDDAGRFRRIQERFWEDDAAAGTVLDQIALRSRFLANGQLAACRACPEEDLEP